MRCVVVMLPSLVRHYFIQLTLRVEKKRTKKQNAINYKQKYGGSLSVLSIVVYRNGKEEEKCADRQPNRQRGCCCSYYHGHAMQMTVSNATFATEYSLVPTSIRMKSYSRK